MRWVEIKSMEQFFYVLGEWAMDARNQFAPPPLTFFSLKKAFLSEFFIGYAGQRLFFQGPLCCAIRGGVVSHPACQIKVTLWNVPGPEGDIRVGDVVMVEDGHEFPCDLPGVLPPIPLPFNVQPSSE